MSGNCTNNSGSNEQISKRIFYLMRQQYNFKRPRLFAFSTQSIEWDDVDDIDLRVIPRIGAGYRVFQEERYKLSFDLGPA